MVRMEGKRAFKILTGKYIEREINPEMVTWTLHTLLVTWGSTVPR